ncbi:hypothetical protein [Ignicoccus hospitalis]|uniref:Uncharacterized protein n=1 Tax=Ignicoccus hospitalis (strain KIN4/I / DSM 18386 / JCM 14125) TaxID=453591 RepID=A8ABP8_IGNH4|nr:hypothetical protein [Ignicoccus hospitalis]ABU82350.1 hypothetical protein Igni_1173 [Ignicoccus hospitalis KIN4/I]HIH89712.1 hypothetical protein [Desulfurococcaceae archaeon]
MSSPQKVQINKKLLVLASVAVAVIAGLGITFLVLSSKPPKAEVTQQERFGAPAEEVPKVSVEYPLEFVELEGAATAQPLTYPDEDGTAFLFVNTINETQEIWTIKGNKVVGKFEIKGPVVPVFDPRKGESATLDGKLLLGVNGTLYAIYGDEAEPLGKYAHSPDARVGIFVKKNDVYAWEVREEKLGNDTWVYCTLYDVLKDKVASNITFNLGANVSATNPLPDLLDGDGCLVLWLRKMSPIMYYHYKGKGGEAKGEEDLIKMKVATFAPIFLENEPYSSKPYFMLISLGERGTFVLRFHDILDNETVLYSLPGIYNFVGVGDYLGNGYVGDALFLVATRRGFEAYIFDVNNMYQNFTIGKLEPAVAVATGISLEPKVKRVFGLGNFTNTTITIKSNVGELKFKVKNVPQEVSSLFITLTMGKRTCYTAVVNPTVGGLTTQQQVIKGKVYLASGCWG